MMWLKYIPFIYQCAVLLMCLLHFLRKMWTQVMSYESVHKVLADLLLLSGHPDKQKEADKKHRALAAKTSNMNDFATLLSVFQSCKSRWKKLSTSTARCILHDFMCELLCEPLIRSIVTDLQRGVKRTGSTGGRLSQPLVWRLSCETSFTDSSR